ncbi:MAG: GTPase Era [Acutalibacteraceae bacterium]|nr:GTPase Era [Acutalibacteraceae bacterium]
MSNTTSAFIAIVGKPNVGKSSILNKIVGQKIAIVSDKPQTTRTRISGIITKDEMQMVFIDTPGLHKPKNALGEHMVKAVKDGMADVDCCLLVVEANAKIAPAEQELINKFKQRKLKAVLAINKVDLLENKEELFEIIKMYSEAFDFSAVVPVSAKNNEGLDELLSELEKFAVPSPHYFDDNAFTDQPERVITAEIIREKLLRLLDKEVPHGIAVDIERFSERQDADILDIEASVYCERQSHKGIVIGKGGQTLKKIGTLARRDLEDFFEIKVNLKLWVKVKENWRTSNGIIHGLGLD